MEVIEDKISNVFKNSESCFFSEVLIILDNDEIEKQIDII